MSNRNIEKGVEKDILQYLEFKGCFPCKLENTGVYDPTKKTFRKVTSKYKRKGISDIMFFYKGVVWFAEIKSPEALGYIERHFERLENGEVKSKENITRQIDFLISVRCKQQIGIFVDSVDRLKELMAQNLSNVPFY